MTLLRLCLQALIPYIFVLKTTLEQFFLLQCVRKHISELGDSFRHKKVVQFCLIGGASFEKGECL